MPHFEIEAGRREALNRFFAYVDAHPGRYETTKEQHAVLQTIIRQHDLKDLYSPRGGSSQTRDLTPLRFRRLLADIRRAHMPKGSQISRMFNRGSRAVSVDLLERIKYTASLQIADSESSNAEEDDSVTEFDHGGAHGEKAVRGRTSCSDTPVQEADSLDPAKCDDNDAFSDDSPRSQPHAAALGHDVTPTRKPAMQPLSPPPISPLSDPPHPVVEIPVTRLRSQLAAGTLTQAGPSARREKPAVASDLSYSRQLDTIEVAQKNSQEDESDDASAQLAKAPNSFLTQANPVTGSTINILKLGDSDVIRGLSDILGRVQSTTQKLILGLDLDNEQEADLVISPIPELRKLYRRLFGPQWQRRAREMMYSERFNVRCIVEACTAAAIHESVWAADLPWIGPERDEAQSPSMEWARGRVMQNSNFHMSLRELDWQAESLRIQTKEFREETIRPHAETLAENFMLTMKAQIKQFGSTRDWKKPGNLWHETARDYVAIFSKAILLRGQIRAGRDYYRITWPESGHPVDPELTEELNEGSGRREIMWTVSPMVQKKERPEAEWNVVYQARVYSQQQSG